jgi:hypothetical protein
MFSTLFDLLGITSSPTPTFQASRACAIVFPLYLYTDILFHDINQTLALTPPTESL